jgi:hypothetical protein
MKAIRKLIRGGGNPIPQQMIALRLAIPKPKVKGAFGGAKKRAARFAFIAESCAQGNEQTRERQLRQSYTKFFRTEDGRKFWREFGKSIETNGAQRGGYRKGAGGEDSLDFCDPADLPQASILDHPVEHIEPLQNSGAEMDGISFEEIKIATITFETSMRWCIDGDGLVAKGLRSSVVISIMRVDLRNGLKIDKELEKAFLETARGRNGEMAHAEFPDSPIRPFADSDSALQLSGRLFGPVLEWLRRGDKISELGERIMVLFYVLRPDLIGENTLAALGRISNKTRQAKDKLANCLRDTYSGIKARAMRGDITRTRCRESQLAIGNI